MPRMSLISSDATTAPAEKGNGYNPDRLGLVINLVISSNYNKNCVFVVAIFVWLFWRKEEDCFGRVVVKLVARYFLEVESVSKLSTHSLSSRQVQSTFVGGWGCRVFGCDRKTITKKKVEFAKVKHETWISPSSNE